MTKITTFFLLIIVLIGCKTDDDAAVNFDEDLLFGTWTKDGFCAEQNTLTINSDGTYLRRVSGNEFCDINESCTVEITGNYNPSGDDIGFVSASEEVIDQGSTGCVQDSEPNRLVRSDVVLLTDTSLHITHEYDPANAGVDNYTYTEEFSR